MLTRKDRGKRSVGPGVIDAFYAGYDLVEDADYPFLCKLDLDLLLPPRYFEILMQKMESDPTHRHLQRQGLHRGERRSRQ